MITSNANKISSFELLAVARESVGRDYIKGDKMLCEKRFHKDTVCMVEFIILKTNNQYGNKGEHHRRFLTESEYDALFRCAKQKDIKMKRFAKTSGSELFYSSLPLQEMERT